MAIDPDLYYGTVAGGDTYFTNRLYETDWSTASADDKAKALLAATGDVDRLDFAGYKTPVFDLLEADPHATAEEIADAEAEQLLAFPRDGDDTVPQAIIDAVYEIAHERLRGRDPNLEQENLRITSGGVGSTRSSLDTSGAANQHLANGIVSFVAWRLLLPFLDDGTSFDVNRV